MAKKRNSAYELIGQIVMVDPSIAAKDDSSQPGVVFSVIPQNGLAHIELSDRTQAEYPIEKLITLAPKTLIMQRLLSNWEISNSDFRSALKICKLISQKRFAEALDIVGNNDAVKSLCTVNCSDWLKITNRKNTHKGLGR